MSGSTSEGGGGLVDAPASISGGDRPLGTAVFGFVPVAATEVRIETERGSRTFPTFRHPARPGWAFYFASVPDSQPSRVAIIPVGGDGRDMRVVRVQG
jgi:hypothetical protein